MDSNRKIEVEAFSNPRYAYVRVRAEVLGIGLVAIQGTRGRLNGAPVLGCATGTLLLADISLPPARDNGSYTGEAELTFIYNAIGWNDYLSRNKETGDTERKRGDFYKYCHFSSVYGFEVGLVAEVSKGEEGQTDTKERGGDRAAGVGGGKSPGSIPPGTEHTQEGQDTGETTP